MVAIPAELLHAIAAPGGGQVALVIGAGCSVEAPTSMPLAAELAREACRQLVLDKILAEGECANPQDLAALASLVWAVTQGQGELVKRFPRDAMRQARPNLGHKLLAALMAENAISHVLSLNFDFAVENAAVHLGYTIPTIDSPGQDVPVRPALVYLHGSVISDPERLVLRTEAIDEGWKNQWEQVVATQVLSAPRILFAGLGSAAPVLSATLAMIQEALGAEKTIYQADIGELEGNALAEQLNIPAERYIRGGWCEVVEKLGERIVADQVHALKVNGQAILAENAFPPEDQVRFTGIVEGLTGVSLLALGKLRAFAQLDRNVLYRAHSPQVDAQIAEPLVRLATLSEVLGLEVRPTAGGTWQLCKDGRPRAQILLASGGGVLRLAAVEPRARELCAQIAFEVSQGPDVILIGGLMASQQPPAQIDIIADGDPESLIDGLSHTPIVSANDPDFIERIGALLNAA